ncbi:DUF3971 domain-containing protein, partial [Halorhodospira neutriphila]
GGPRLDVRAAVEGVEAAAVPRYVPAGVTPPEVRRWLGTALQGGRVARADLLFHGDPADFPFDGQEGVFAVDAAVRGGVLRYAPGWPAITGIDAALRFRGARLAIDGAGRTAGVALRGVEVTIADLRRPRLAVAGQARGDAGDALGFLAGSPLGRGWLGEAVPVEAAGPVRVGLDLALPLAPQAGGPPQVEGRVALSGVTAALPPWLRLGALSGSLAFDEAGIHHGRLSARWGGEPASLTVETERVAGRRRIVLEGRGRPATRSVS